MPAAPTTAEIERTLLAEISGMFPENPAITSSTSIQTLGLDSLRLFELFVLVEKQFGLSLLDGPLTRDTLESIASLAAHISARIASES